MEKKNFIKQENGNLSFYKALIMLFLFLMPTLRISAESFPACKNAYVNDYANILSNEQLQQLRDDVKSMCDYYSTKIVVGIVPSFGQYSIDEYAKQIGQMWNVTQNDGMLILVKPKSDVENGEVILLPSPDLSDVLTSEVCNEIVHKNMIPHFKENDYYGGIQAVLVYMNNMSDENQSQTVAPSLSSNEQTSDYPSWIWIVIGVGGLLLVVLFFRDKKTSEEEDDSFEDKKSEYRNRNTKKESRIMYEEESDDDYEEEDYDTSQHDNMNPTEVFSMISKIKEMDSEEGISGDIFSKVKNIKKIKKTARIVAGVAAVGGAAYAGKKLYDKYKDKENDSSTDSNPQLGNGNTNTKPKLGGENTKPKLGGENAKPKLGGGNIKKPKLGGDSNWGSDLSDLLNFGSKSDSNNNSSAKGCW